MSKKEIAELATQCRALGWEVENTPNGLYRILPPGKDPIISPANTNGPTLAKFKAELDNAGYTTASTRPAKTGRSVFVAPTPTPVAPPATLVNPFAPPLASFHAPVATSPEAIQQAKIGKALAGYPRYTAGITQDEARTISSALKALKQKEREEGTNESHQRNLYPLHVAKLQQAMELGEWALNPVDSLVFGKKGGILNGQHRMEALSQADTEFIETFYPDGVPFEVVTDFPESMAHIFDTNKARSASDSLTAAGLRGWGPLPAAALRLAMNYDQSFKVDEEGNKTGVELWTRWRKVQHTNTETVSDADGRYGGLLDWNKVAGRAYSRSRVTRSATIVAAFLMDRDNPGGGPGKTNQSFWDGVCGDADMKAGDPRMALVRYAQRKGGHNADNGPCTLAHILLRYADYMIGGKKVENSNVNKELPMPPVWQPGMNWFGSGAKRELRFRKR